MVVNDVEVRVVVVVSGSRVTIVVRKTVVISKVVVEKVSVVPGMVTVVTVVAVVGFSDWVLVVVTVSLTTHCESPPGWLLAGVDGTAVPLKIGGGSFRRLTTAKHREKSRKETAHESACMIQGNTRGYRILEIGKWLNE